jgi:hypothetical protein
VDDPTNFVKQDSLLRELVAAERYEEVVERFEARAHGSGPGSVVAYLQALGKLDRLQQFDTRQLAPSQLSMAAAAAMRDAKNLNRTSEEATQAVAVGLAGIICDTGYNHGCACVTVGMPV